MGWGVPHSSWWGYPHATSFPMGGNPHQDRMGVPPSTLDRTTPIRIGWGGVPPCNILPNRGGGVTPSALDGGTPINTGWDYPPSGLDGVGYPILHDGGYPHPSHQGIPHPSERGDPGMGYPNCYWMGAPPLLPETEQQSEHLLVGWRYASCVHAGGLSFSYWYPINGHEVQRSCLGSRSSPTSEYDPCLWFNCPKILPHGCIPDELTRSREIQGKLNRLC